MNSNQFYPAGRVIKYYDNISLFSSKNLELIVIVKRGNSSLIFF